MRTLLFVMYASRLLLLLIRFDIAVVAQTQECPDSAILKCISYIVEPISGSSVVDQQITQACNRSSGLTTCLPLPPNGCRADKPVTKEIRDAVQAGMSKLCSASRERLVTSAGCWSGANTASKINSCNNTFMLNLLTGAPFCDAGGSYLTCVQTAVLADCGSETMIYYTTFTHTVLIAYAIAKGCQIWNNKCFPWNITSCLNNINIQTSWVTLGKDTLRSNLEQICRREDSVSTCLKSQSCPSSNTFYSLISSRVESAYSAVCHERDRTSSYDSFADCWTKDSVKSGLTACNNTLQTSLNTSASYCSSVNAFLQCSQDLVTRECSADSGRSIAAYFYSLNSISATVNNCALDPKFAPTISISTYGSTHRSAAQTDPATTPEGLIEKTTSSASRELVMSQVLLLLPTVVLSHTALASSV